MGGWSGQRVIACPNPLIPEPWRMQHVRETGKEELRSPRAVTPVSFWPL